MARRDDWREPRLDRLPLETAGREEIMDVHRAALVAGESGYLDPVSGLFVMTAGYLVDRGWCCGQGCRHCPYEPGDEEG